jgi:hypothetical protein
LPKKFRVVSESSSALRRRGARRAQHEPRAPCTWHLAPARRSKRTRSMRPCARRLTLLTELVHSITRDQAKDLSQHVSFTFPTGAHICFCDPHSPWQPGSNESTSGFIRQYTPKATDLSSVLMLLPVSPPVSTTVSAPRNDLWNDQRSSPTLLRSLVKPALSIAA